MELYPHLDTWTDADPHANFKAEAVLYTVMDPFPALDHLSQATSIPVPCLIGYVLV